MGSESVGPPLKNIVCGRKVQVARKRGGYFVRLCRGAK